LNFSSQWRDRAGFSPASLFSPCRGTQTLSNKKIDYVIDADTITRLGSCQTFAEDDWRQGILSRSTSLSAKFIARNRAASRQQTRFLMSFRPTARSPEDTANKTVTPESLSGGLSTLFLGAVILLFVAVRLWRLTATCLWFDEIFSIHAARHGWAELLRFVAADIIHPPLFYLLLKIWIAVGGESLLWLRLLPFLVSVAAILPFLLLGRELELNRSERNLALLLLAVNGYLIKYAQELRMYSLLMLLSLCSVWLFIKFLKAEQASRKQLVWLFLVNLFLVYSHYAGWLGVILEASALLIWQRRRARQFLAGIAVTMLAYAPWVFLVLRNEEAGKGLAQNIGWVMRPTLRDVTQLYALLNKPFWFIQSSAARPFDGLTALFALIIFGVPLLLWLVKLWRSGKQATHGGIQQFQALFLFFITPIFIVFGLSWLLPQSIWGTRHLIIVAAPYSILTAVAVTELGRGWARTAVCTIVGMWFVLAGATWVFSPPPVYIWCAWEPLARQLTVNQPQAEDGVRIYTFEDLIAYHLWFALNSDRQNHFSVAVVKNVDGIQEDPAYFVPRRFNDIATIHVEQITGNNIWIAYRAASFDKTRPPLSTLKNMGYEVADIDSLLLQGQQAFLLRMVLKQ
jgi:mannosyltransferase